MNISCASCHVRLKKDRIGIHVIEYNARGMYRLYRANLLGCPLCGHQVVSGYSQATTVDGTPPSRALLDIALTDPYHVCIYEDQEQREWFEPGDNP